QSDRRKQIDQTVALGVAYADTHELARRDALTRASNRLTWEEAVDRNTRSDAAFGVVFADVDGLKSANDQYGHEMGDRLLTAVAEILINETSGRPDVVVARVGGDEFALLIPNASLFSTHAVASS